MTHGMKKGMVMRRPRTALLSTILVILLAALMAGPAPAAAGDGVVIYLARATFDPVVGGPTVDGPLAGLHESPSAGSVYLLQFEGPVQADWKRVAEAAGVQLLSYLPDHTFTVRLSYLSPAAAGRLPHVRWVGPYQPAYKLDPSLDTLLGASDPLDVVVHLFPGESRSSVEKAIRAAGGQVREAASSGLVGDTLRATLTGADLAGLARLPAISWIAPYFPMEPFNDRARTVMAVDLAQATLAGLGTNLYGAGQIVSVADTGLDTGNESTLSLDFRDHFVKGYAIGRPGTGDWSDGLAGCSRWCGHGTHVAGSAVGSGINSGANPGTHDYDSSFAGVAPQAGLIMQSLLTASETFVTPLDLGNLFGPAHNDGARIHTNSWGHPTGGTSVNPTYGGYDAAAASVDAFMWLNPTSLVLFSAGNAGVDANGDGVIDLDQVASPATAKNVLSVGATENNRPPFTGFGGYSNYKWGSGSWAPLYPVNPIRDDYISNNPEGMAAFSSRGPADDGRIKPDLVAPGTDIISARSHGLNAGYGWGPHDIEYIYNGGTSMAAPLTAGAAALVRQYYVDFLGHTSPSAALVKATLINGAQNLAPGQYGGGGTQEIPSASPNNVSGFGRVNLSNALGLNANESLRFWDHTAGLNVGDTLTYTLAIIESGGPGEQFSAALCWTDWPGLVFAGKELINDLDLEVIGPGDTRYRGNGGATADRTNNTERVVIDQPPAGSYQIVVRAHNIPLHAQPFALVVQSEHLSDTPNPTPTVTGTSTATVPTPTATPTSLTPTASATATPTETSQPTSGWVPIFQDGFEGAFPGEWTVFDQNGSTAGEYFWQARDCRPHAGESSAWAVGGGSNGSTLVCGSNYPNDAAAWLIYGPFSLANATDADLRFRMWLNSAAYSDYFSYLISTDGGSFMGYQVSGSSSGGWIDRTLSLATDPGIGSLLGEESVWIAFIFSSDGSGALPEGVYIDDVLIRQYLPEITTATATATSTPTMTRTSTPTQTASATATTTATPTPTPTASATATSTSTDAPPATSTPSPSATSTHTESATATATGTVTVSSTATATGTPTSEPPRRVFLPLVWRQ